MPQLVDKTDDHTDKDLHTAQGERPQHYHDDIIDGGEKRLPEPCKGTLRIEELNKLRDKISEKAAGHGAQNKGGNSA